LRDEANLLALTEDVLKTSAIEGEQLNLASVRSSVARRLGVDIGAWRPVDRHGRVVDMIFDATAHHRKPLTAKASLRLACGLVPDRLFRDERNHRRRLAR
jgi:hypothetical protein